MTYKLIIKGNGSRKKQLDNNIVLRTGYCVKRERAFLTRRYFVNTLINHLEALKAYEELKLKLAIDNDENSLESAKANADFIRNIIEKVKDRSCLNYD